MTSISKRKSAVVNLYKQCYVCGEDKEVSLTKDEYNSYCKYLNGEGCIQDMLPNVPAPERELLKGGMCGECWRRMFALPPWEEETDIEEQEESE